MSLSLYFDNGSKKNRKNPGPLAISLAAHGAAFLGLMHAPRIELPERAKSEYKQAIEGKEEKLVWYKFAKELPAVTPRQARTAPKPLRAEVRAKQEIVASRKNAPRRPQMVWTPAPELNVNKPVESPNLLAIRFKVAKPFVPPPDVKRPELAKVEIRADAPELKTQALRALRIADAPKLTRRFVAPPTQVPLKLAEIAPITEAPRLDTNAAISDGLKFSFKSPSRPFTAPATKAVAAPVKQVTLETPPDLPGANSRDLNLAVVGLNPSIRPVPLPENSSPGQFSAAPTVRPDGADAADEGKGLSVPDLFVRGAREAKPELIAQAYAAPTSDLTLRAAARSAGPKTASAEDRAENSGAAAVKVSSAPDPRFDGRDIYMMAIQMPNLTSYSGSWLMWYSDRTAREAGLSPVAPPVAHRKVDPKYVATAAADRIEGKVQLACVIGKDGHVSTVELVRGLDDRLNQSAEEALAKWEFTPATRRGEPVDVDVLVEIPFKLAPRVPVAF
jgi:TonB family protein